MGIITHITFFPLIELPHPYLDDEEVESLRFVETFRKPLKRAMENESYNELHGELAEANHKTQA
jgi:hypothetical protein